MSSLDPRLDLRRPPKMRRRIENEQLKLFAITLAAAMLLPAAMFVHGLLLAYLPG